ncbi:MAG TPA: serine hydrolase [Streptosporangiaceae bacterium]|jgi:D-alanyl-D-alanine carboxypeptidase (penicillin-binding protein 5/6)
MGACRLTGIILTVTAAAVAASTVAVSAATPAVAAPGAAVPAAAVTAGALTAPGRAAIVAPHVAAPNVRVRGGELVNHGSGARLWGQAINVKRPMASITKVMAALVVLRAGHLDRRIKVTRKAVSYVRRNGASNAGLVAGDVLTARQLLKAMLIPSGCDAAFLLATSYGPRRPVFVRKMNAMAKSMGLTSTHFAHFDGLPIPTGRATYSTPRDLVRLGEQAMRNPLFHRIVAVRTFRVAARPHHHGYVWRTTNKLLGSYRGAIGIKTGNTNAAGNCLLFEARRGGHTLIGVILHANPSSNWDALFSAARRVLNWGFRRV